MTMTSTLRRNWDAIRAIPHRAVQIALATCDHADTLEGLRRGFPECFEEGEETALLGAWTAIQEKHLAACQADRNEVQLENEAFRLVNWGEYLELPFAVRFGRVGTSGDAMSDGPIPQKLLKLFSEIDLKKLDGPLVVGYDDSEWIIAQLEGSDQGLGIPDEKGGFVTLVPKSLVVLDM